MPRERCRRPGGPSDVGTAAAPYASAAVIDPAPPEPNRRALGCLLELAETVVLTLILFWVIQSFVAQPFQVRQFSMQDTIQNDQFVLVDRLTPHFDAYHRGDIIVFHPPTEVDESPDRTPFIKRVIGIAGDRIDIVDGKVQVNGIVLDEPYLYAENGVAQPTDVSGDTASWTIGPDELFVMGDHRARSSDSRVFGPIRTDAVIGRAWLRYWPLDDFGVLPTDSHPELSSPAPGASPGTSAKPSARPSTKPSPRASRSPRP
jgi:signal peptidase I